MANLDVRLCRKLLTILPTISILDPACGDGAFLVAALDTLTGIYEAITGNIAFTCDPHLVRWLEQTRAEQNNLTYPLKKKIIRENLFGVDIMEEAVEMAKLRLYLSLVSSMKDGDTIEPMVTIDYNIRTGNALIGLLRLDEDAHYRNPSYFNQLLFDEFKRLGVKYERATWDSEKQSQGKSIPRALNIDDIEALHPFHWGHEFSEVMNERGGFDTIVTNPPWEIFKPQAKEFFATHSDLVSKNKMRIEDFEKEQAKLLQDPEIRSAWLDYASRFAYQSAYFRSAAQYRNQISIINGRKHNSDINLYKLFTGQCYNLLREGGQCGLVIPSGIYTDLGARQLRQMLFEHTQVTGMCCFENAQPIFPGVHRSYKFVALTFEKGGETRAFPAAFLRHDVGELQNFPGDDAVAISVDLIRRLAPDSLSVMEFRHEMDVRIAQKMLQYPLLGERLGDTWNLVLTNEFHMTNDSSLFRMEPEPGSLPLYEGKMIHQFTTYRSMTSLAQPRYWVDEQLGRSSFLGRKSDSGQTLDYQYYRLAYRSIGRKSDQRALIATILPCNVFAGNSLFISRRLDAKHGSALLGDWELLYLAAILNSFIADYFIGQKISANLNMFYIYQLPIPRLTKKDALFSMIVELAARLICTTPEYQKLWHVVMPGIAWSPDVAAIKPAERARLRAELDGLIAHLYGLTEEEFCHILETFPLVEQSVKSAARGALERQYTLQSKKVGQI
ncbi:MAG TPA: DNA methyltransferase [Ktedonobacteraceae bacterium]